jgi:hypothetical protein
VSARRRHARSVRPDRSPINVPSSLFGYPVQIVDKLAEPTTQALIADKIRMGLIRTDVDEDDLLKLCGDPFATDRPVGVLNAKSSPFKIYRPEAN